jgi:hypothetical protein
VKPNSAHAHSACSACRGPATTPNRPGWHSPHGTGRPSRRGGPRASEARPGAAPGRRLEHVRERSRLARHPARKCGRQGIRAGRRRGGGSHRCATAASGGSDGRGGRPRLRKLLRGGWVLWDLPRKKGGGWLGLAMVSWSRKQGQKRWHPYRRTAKPKTQTKCMGKAPFILVWAEGGWDEQDGSALAATLSHDVSATHARAGADGAASGCCDGLTWRQLTHGIVL